MCSNKGLEFRENSIYFGPQVTQIIKGLGLGQIVYTLGPKYLHWDYFKAKVHTIWAHGPLGQIPDKGIIHRSGANSV